MSTQRIISMKCNKCDDKAAKAAGFSQEMFLRTLGNGSVQQWACPFCANVVLEHLYDDTELVEMGAVLAPLTNDEMLEAVNAALSMLASHGLTGGDVVANLCRIEQTIVLRERAADFPDAKLFDLAGMIERLAFNYHNAAKHSGYLTSCHEPQCVNAQKMHAGIFQSLVNSTTPTQAPATTPRMLCQGCAHDVAYHNETGCTYGHDSDVACECLTARAIIESSQRTDALFPHVTDATTIVTVLNDSDVTSDKVPDMIATDYQWTCPECDSLQDETEIAEFVKCRECGQVFRTNGAEHAYGTLSTTSEPAPQSLGLDGEYTLSVITDEDIKKCVGVRAEKLLGNDVPDIVRDAAMELVRLHEGYFEFVSVDEDDTTCFDDKTESRHIRAMITVEGDIDYIFFALPHASIKITAADETGSTSVEFASWIAFAILFIGVLWFSLIFAYTAMQPVIGTFAAQLGIR